jgi:hypothetical protein
MDFMKKLELSDVMLSEEEAISKAHSLGFYLWSTHNMEVLPVTMMNGVVILKAKPVGGDDYISYNFEYSENSEDYDTNTKVLLQDMLELMYYAFEWIDAVPEETPLPAMPGFDRDWADDLMAKVKEYLKK